MMMSATDAEYVLYYYDRSFSHSMCPPQTKRRPGAPHMRHRPHSLLTIHEHVYSQFCSSHPRLTSLPTTISLAPLYQPSPERPHILAVDRVGIGIARDNPPRIRPFREELLVGFKSVVQVASIYLTRSEDYFPRTLGLKPSVEDSFATDSINDHRSIPVQTLLRDGPAVNEDTHSTVVESSVLTTIRAAAP